MQVAVIAVENVINAYQQAVQVSSADLIELRLDYLEDWCLDGLSMLFQSIEQPVIATIRKDTQGGVFKLGESERLKRLLEVSALSPAYIDLEMEIDLNFIQKLKKKHPDLKIIRSCHVMEETPEDLDGLLHTLQHPDFDLFKLVTMAKTSLDGMRLMHWLQTQFESDQIKKPFICFAMGMSGQFTRIIAPIIGSAFAYSMAAAQNPTIADGQMNFQNMQYIYGMTNLSKTTRIYALIGDPVAHSVGDQVHNTIYKEKNCDAIYIKIRLQTSLLPQFFNYARSMPIFKGFSVTSPFKTTVVSELSSLSNACKTIQSVNTIKREKNAFLGFNTDGMGALDAIENKQLVADKQVLVLGAGGTARSIIFEAMQRGALVTCVNRDQSKAENLALQFGCQVVSIHDIRQGLSSYEMIINTVSSQLNVFSLFFPKELLQGIELVMDCNYSPHETALLRQAKRFSCKVVYGIEMYVKQAVAQLAIWFGDSWYTADLEQKLHEILSEHFKIQRRKSAAWDSVPREI